VDWTDVRIICLAPNYKWHALYAVQKMGVRIQLWTYRFFENNAVYTPAHNGPKGHLDEGFRSFNVLKSLQSDFHIACPGMPDVGHITGKAPKKLYVAYKAL